MRISLVTRRDIIDSIVADEIKWSGRPSEPDFLARMFDLQNIPSRDYRFQNAYGDIRQHRINNDDWDDDWVFYDTRFNIIHADDEIFLRFLCETLHPIVRVDPEEVEQLRQLFNQHLRNDGYEIVERTRLSGRPVFSARLMDIAPSTALEAAKESFATIDAAYITQQITRMEAALLDDPDLALGTAKELLETCCKTILKERDVQLVGTPDLPQLIKQTIGSLEIISPDIPNQARTTDSLRRLVSSLATIAQSITELRNYFGTGHGREADSMSLLLRHAKLAVGAASTLAVFLLETHHDSPAKRTR